MVERPAADLSMQLGELRGTLSALRESVTEIKVELRRQSEARHELAQTIQVMVGRIEELARQMGAMQGDVTPLLDLRKTGAGVVVAGSAVVTVLGFLFGPTIRDALARIFH